MEPLDRLAISFEKQKEFHEEILLIEKELKERDRDFYENGPKNESIQNSIKKIKKFIRSIFI